MRIFTVIDAIFIENVRIILIMAQHQRNDALGRPFSSVVRASDS